VNLNGLLRTTSRGFEDRGASVRCHPLPCARDRGSDLWIRQRPPTLGAGCDVGCFLGCHRRHALGLL